MTFTILGVDAGVQTNTLSNNDQTLYAECGGYPGACSANNMKLDIYDETGYK